MIFCAVATGRDQEPRPEPLPGWLFRRLAALRPYLATLALAAALLLALAAVPALEPYRLGLLEALIIAALSSLPLLLLRANSLAAWRISWLVTLISGLSHAYERAAPWPANPVAIFVFLYVLLVVGYRQPPGVLFWVWLLSDALIWVFTVRANGAGATLLITAVLLVGYLVRRWAQTRGTLTAELAAEQERGVVLTERARIARELHDVVAHHMSLIAVRAETAPYRLGDLPEPARGEFAEIFQGIARGTDRDAPAARRVA